MSRSRRPRSPSTARRRFPGLSQSGGFKLIVEDRGGLGLKALQQQTETLTAELAQHSGLNNVITTFRPHTPQLLLNVDRDKVEAFGVPLSDVNQTMQIYLGSSAAGFFNDFWPDLAGHPPGRREISQQRRKTSVSSSVRNNKGEMVPLGVLINLVPQDGPPVAASRYNLHSRRASITWATHAQGVSLRARRSATSRRRPSGPAPAGHGHGVDRA